MQRQLTKKARKERDFNSEFIGEFKKFKEFKGFKGLFFNIVAKLLLFNHNCNFSATIT
jgi:hypothetical protein